MLEIIWIVLISETDITNILCVRCYGVRLKKKKKTGTY